MESGQNKQPKPNFLIVGAAKAGTTSLAKYLGAHPDIFIPEQKELRFFIKDTILQINPKDPLLEGILKQSILDKEKYFNLFDVKEEVTGDASVHYLYHHQEAIPNIKKHIGDVHIIIMLRNPVQRAISNYEFLSNIHCNTFEKELELEEERSIDNYNSFWYYKQLGLYSKQVEAYLNNFSNVKIILFEEFIKDPAKEIDKVYDFLNLKSIKTDFKVHNQSKPHNPFRKFLGKIGVISFFNLILRGDLEKKLKNEIRPFFARKNKSEYSKETLSILIKYFEKDITNLEKLTGFNLHLWSNNYTN